MLPSNSTNDDNDPIYYIDPTFHHKPFLNDSNNPPFPFFHIPSPFYFYPEEDEVFLHNQDHFFQNQPPLLETDCVAPEINTTSMMDPPKDLDRPFMGDPKKKTYEIGPIDHSNSGSRKRASAPKRDRHSKINTAQGPRDRRMRLSLEIARKFFGLQDMLGFDKASKTVEWLLINSKSEIKKLADAGGQRVPMKENVSASSSSECEEVSGIDEVTVNEDQLGNMSISKQKPSDGSASILKERKIRPFVRKTAFNPIARESRANARARARERTNDKKRIRSLHESKAASTKTTNQELNQVGSCWSIPFEAAREESGSQSYNNMNPSSLEVLTEVEKPVNSFVINGKWNSSTIFSYPQNNNGNKQENQLGDFPFYKIWETSNNTSLL